jgi:hypothetical protein
MRYMLLICTDPAREEAERAKNGEAILAEYGAFAEEMGNRGVLRGGERLRPASDAKTVRVENGNVLTSDGPFAETKEQIGGYFIVECSDAKQAVEIAAKIPGARHGGIEVRPIWEM